MRLLSERPDGHLLGDAGYATLPFLMTPLRSGDHTPAEAKYQEAHKKTRNEIERFFGCWKSKFQCLKGMRLKLDTSLTVISACAVLWNFLLANGELDQEISSSSSNESQDCAAEQQQQQPPAASLCSRELSREGFRKRSLIIDHLFS